MASSTHETAQSYVRGPSAVLEKVDCAAIDKLADFAEAILHS